MKYIFILISLTFLTITQSNAYSSKIKTAHAIGIFHQNGNGENIQHVRKTKDDYNGICYSKIVVFGKTHNIKASVKIGESVGSLIKTISIYNKQKIKIAEEMTFKHYNVSKGYIEVRVLQKLYDSKVFVK
jgi:hypothetical protein